MSGSGYLVMLAVVSVVVAAFTIGPAPAGAVTEPAEGNELERIENEAEELRERIVDLNGRLEEMGLGQRYSLEVSPHNSRRRILEELTPKLHSLELQRLQRRLAPPSPVPEGWTPHEYEGGTYYFIPAESSAFGDE